MNKHTLIQGEPWMTPEERDLNHEFVQSTTAQLAARGIPETPLLIIRVNDVIATWLLARRLESALTPEPGEPAPCPSPAQAGAIGKCRDRLRRAMKELDACCPPDTDPAEDTLASQMLQATQKPSNTAPHNEAPNQHETQPTNRVDDTDSNQHVAPRTEYHDPNPTPNTALPIIPRQPEPRSSTPTQTPPIDPQNEQSPLLNRAARRRQAVMFHMFSKKGHDVSVKNQPGKVPQKETSCPRTIVTSW